MTQIGEDIAGERRSLRRRTYDALNPRGRLTVTARLIILLILVATASAILETEPTIVAGHEERFRRIELLFAFLFSAEYALRIWSAAEGPDTRLRYALRPASLLDLAVVVGTFAPFVGTDVVVLRLARLLRILRLGRVGRYSRAFGVLERAIRSRAPHLWVAFLLALFFLLFGATLIHWIEGDAQPEHFGSIPRALWWTAVTMTTVGYGDVVPITALGKLVAGLISMGGIAVIAIPTGILAASFSDEIAREAEAKEGR
jgi:voltage-gated potassium channel